MYTKFITLFLDNLLDEEKGFISAARYLHENGIISDEKRHLLGENLAWVEEHLNKRPDFSPLSDEDIFNIPMSWLKSNASEHIARMQQIREILEENDILVEVLEVESPGKILYEDAYQVVAVPFDLGEVELA